MSKSNQELENLIRIATAENLSLNELMVELENFKINSNEEYDELESSINKLKLEINKIIKKYDGNRKA